MGTKVTLIDYDIIGSGKLPKRLDDSFGELQCWCKATGHILHMTKLTKNQLGLDTAADFPVASLGVVGVCFDGCLQYEVLYIILIKIYSMFVRAFRCSIAEEVVQRKRHHDHCEIPGRQVQANLS